jgi:hypothetical protein
MAFEVVWVRESDVPGPGRTTTMEGAPTAMRDKVSDTGLLEARF